MSAAPICLSLQPSRSIAKFLLTIREWLARFGEDTSPNRREAEWVLAHLLGVPRLGLPLDELVPAGALPLSSRLEAGEPLQYVLGETDFFGLTVSCDPRALIPRPETEQLIELVLERVPHDQPVRVLDVGTGTGCIALALAANRPNATILGVDASTEALALARANAERCGLDVRFEHRDLLQGQAAASIDLIVSNLPYITTQEMDSLDPIVRDHEPHLALHGGHDGLDLIRRLIIDAPSALRDRGWLMLEIGYRQGPTLLDLFQEAGFENTEVCKDFANLDRFAIAQKP